MNSTGLLLDIGWPLIAGPVRSMPVVGILVLGEDPSGVGLVQDQNVVESLAADGANHSLAVRIHSLSLKVIMKDSPSPFGYLRR